MKGISWATRLPVVDPPRGQTPKPITLIYPFYENHQFLWTQIDHWRAWPADVRDVVSIIVVDDGSPMPATLPPLPVTARLFRIGVDVRWNWLAARNIGAHHAADGWLLMTDMDHVVPVETLRALIWGQHDPAVVYAFSRQEHTGETIGPHSASFFLTRRLFWTIGGYDEALSGHYGTDGDWRRRVAAHAPIQILRQPLIRYEYVGDSSTQRYRRKQPEDAAVKQLIAQRSKAWRPKVLSFPYQEVSC